jgi:hypothetical protein
MSGVYTFKPDVVLQTWRKNADSCFCKRDVFASKRLLIDSGIPPATAGTYTDTRLTLSAGGTPTQIKLRVNQAE